MGIKVLTPTHLESGIKRVIWNTDMRWIDYSISYDPHSVGVYNLYDFYKLKAQIHLDFDVRGYHRLEEQNKDQIIFYFIPRNWLL